MFGNRASTPVVVSGGEGPTLPLEDLFSNISSSFILHLASLPSLQDPNARIYIPGPRGRSHDLCAFVLLALSVAGFGGGGKGFIPAGQRLARTSKAS